jgi:hypothetical protein
VEEKVFRRFVEWMAIDRMHVYKEWRQRCSQRGEEEELLN